MAAWTMPGGRRALRGVPLWTAVSLLFCAGTVAAADNPLVGVWRPAPEQLSPKVQQLSPRFGELTITQDEISAFGEKSVSYTYERNGNQFRVLVDEPKAKPVDFLLRTPDVLLTRFPNRMDILWHRVSADSSNVAAASAAGATTASAAPRGDPQASAVLAMTMPQSLPTRYQSVDQSLEVLLNDGWRITHASGAGPAMGLVLERDGKHVLCTLMGNQRDRQTGRSDCRSLN